MESITQNEKILYIGLMSIRIRMHCAALTFKGMNFPMK